MTNAVATTASSALPLPAAATETHMHGASPEGTRPALTFSPSTKFSELHVIRQRSAHSQESEDIVSDPDDLTAAQADGARERLYRDKARDAIKKEQVHMEGFLYKKAGGGASKAWNKRWCVLRSQALMIYKRYNEDKLKRVIRADEITEIHPVQRRNHSFVFEVETPTRSFFFEASSDQELDTWLARLKSVVVDINCLHSASSGSNRPSAESCHAPHHPDDDVSRMHFATASRATLKSPLEDAPDAFMSLPTAATHRTCTPTTPANAIFAAQDSGVCRSDGNEPTHIRAVNSFHASKEPEGATIPLPLGLRIDTPHAISLMHSNSQHQDSSANALTALPPGVDQGHEPAPVIEDDEGDDEGEEDEEPNFNVSHRREIETRLEEDRVILRGYLLKQDKLRQWRRRWFVLRQNTLSYYHDDKEYEVKQILRRDDIHDIRGPDPSTAKARSLRRTYFKVVSAKRNYWLAHDEAAVAREWFNALVLWNEPTTSSAFSAKLGGLTSPPLALRQSVSAQPSIGNNSAGLGQRVFSAFTSPSAIMPPASSTK
ncbi:hypothetical protein GGH94_000481 [Coemansia aciculifera]|uniref:PH domain-containing protein n=1 Tax=Coemansia aciculifera TaxID=417176 RepID=A0A9W8IMJ6_9FUNG|nr:hypothetical protein GGH94_000481 [Coemansia aciculifera]